MMGLFFRACKNSYAVFAHGITSCSGRSKATIVIVLLRHGSIGFRFIDFNREFVCPFFFKTFMGDYCKVFAHKITSGRVRKKQVKKPGEREYDIGQIDRLAKIFFVWSMLFAGWF